MRVPSVSLRLSWPQSNAPADRRTLASWVSRIRPAGPFQSLTLGIWNARRRCFGECEPRGDGAARCRCIKGLFARLLQMIENARPNSRRFDRIKPCDLIRLQESRGCRQDDGRRRRATAETTMSVHCRTHSDRNSRFVCCCWSS